MGDAGGITRRAEAALLARISSEYSFPRVLNSATAGTPGAADAAADAASSAILPLLAEHLELDLAKKDPEAWKAVRAAFERAHPWAVRTECLLVEGCDDRITVPYEAGRVTNKYHCSPVPTPEVVSRSSCTSSSSSRRAFGSADDARHDLLLTWALKKGVGRDQTRDDSTHELYDDGGFTNRMSDVRRRLLDVLGMDRNTVESADGPAVTSIVVAAGEVGSGTAGAAGGQHFSKLTPRGTPGRPENHVEGMPAGDVVVVQIKTRSKSGAFLPCEDIVRSAVHKALSSCPTSVVVVHFVAGSKTGICSPSENVLAEMRQRYGEHLLVVVDACQLRLEDQNVRKYVSLGFLTLITGSKFYCGPPFCGAVLFPTEALAELQGGHEHLPAGFDDYFTRHEVDSRYSTLCSRLPSWENRGLFLRWASALTNMEAVKSIPKTRLNAFVSSVRRNPRPSTEPPPVPPWCLAPLPPSWVQEVRDNVQDKWPYLSLLPEQRTGEPSIAVGGVNTVVPIVVRVPRTSSEGPDGNPEVALGYEDLRLFHRLLSEDIGRYLPQDLAMGDRAAAHLRVLFGQPVKLGGASFGVIRIALGADMLMDAFCRGDPPLSEENVPAAGEGGGVARLLTQDRLAVDKCALMARHWHLLKEGATGVPASEPRPKNKLCLETLAMTVKDMSKEELRLLEGLVAARQRELLV
ncbi:unnamed protein product [Ectocarpus sp. CCAP 1310/34]|nr:unnamed protein product [Ectocarpus sp. CCAP 1310/34]